MENYIVWFLIFFVMTLLEIATFNLVSVWFAVGALFCMLLSLFPVPTWVQIVVFLLISVLCMIIIRPIAKRSFHPQEYRSMIGKKCKVIENCGPSTGKVKIGDIEWLAISESNIPKDTIAKVTDVKGVTLVVERI